MKRKKKIRVSSSVDAKTQLRNEIMAQRRTILTALEKERNSKVITLMHRREPWTDVEEEAYITIEDSEFVLTQIRETPKNKSIDLILHTPGGLALAAEMISMALKYHPAPKTVMIPFYAMSGGTLIALAVDEIVMEKYSVLGPVDPQIAGLPAGSLISILERKSMDAISDKTIILSDIAKMALENMQRFVIWLLSDKIKDKQKLESIARFLTGGYITHDTPINFATAKELGLNVKEGISDKVYQLFTTCEFGICKRPCLTSYGNY